MVLPHEVPGAEFDFPPIGLGRVIGRRHRAAPALRGNPRRDSGAVRGGGGGVRFCGALAGGPDDIVHHPPVRPPIQWEGVPFSTTRLPSLGSVRIARYSPPTSHASELG